MKDNNWLNDLEVIVGSKIFQSLYKLPENIKTTMSEIRVFSQGEVCVTVKDQHVILKDVYGLPLKLSSHEIAQIFVSVCDGAVFKYESQIKNGFITVKGGHRIGFCGSAVYNNSELFSIKDISSICIRISRSVVNSAREIIGNIFYDKKIHSTLIAGPPLSGKTTVLTDLLRFFSLYGIICAVIDERSEICAVENGIPQKNIGNLSCVLDGYTKPEGIMIALRCLAPQVIVCDEIGTTDEVEQMLDALNGGVAVVATAHANNYEELLRRPQISTLIEYGGIEKVIFLKGSSNPGVINEIVAVRNNENNWNCTNCD